MMNLIYCESDTFDPYFNLAMEKFLFENVREDDIIMYLWQNESTVVCGRNQNVYKECNLTGLEELGGHVCRRLSGGGAVFHDRGNLNFTFIAAKEHYDVLKQLAVITSACNKLGIHAQITGRNDITVDDRKFSGNAFYKSKGKCLHHGTIMIDVDTSNLSDFLNVSREKLKSKGVDSVRSRVINLKAISPDITVEQMKYSLKEAFYELYEGSPAQADIDTVKIEEYRTFFSSPEWIYGETFAFSNSFGERFAWGEIEANFQVHGGVIKHAKIFSDSLAPDFISYIEDSLPEKKYIAQDICDVIDEAARIHPDSGVLLAADIKTLVKKSI